MIRRVFFLLTIILVALTNVGGCNLYNDVSTKNSDAAIIDDVNNLMDIGAWNDAVLKWYLLSPQGQSLRANKVILATAYSGRGGLDLINLVNNLTANKGAGAKNLFQFLLAAFKGAKTSWAQDQITAEGIMLAIGATAAVRTGDENIFMLFLELAKLGTILASTMDPAGTGTANAGLDNCNTTVLGLNFGAHIATAVGNIFDIIITTGTTITGSTLSNLTGACGAFQGFCTINNTANITPLMNQLARTLAGESNLSLGLAVASNVGKCELTTPYTAFCPLGGATQICP